MRKITFFNTAQNEEFSFLKIENEDDLKAYIEFAIEDSNKEQTKLCSQYRPSHYYSKSGISNLAKTILQFNFGCVDNLKNKNEDIFKGLTDLAFKKSLALFYDTLKSTFDSQGFAYINTVGGIFCGEPTEDMFTSILLEEKNLTMQDLLKRPYLTVNEGSVALALENDPILDPWYAENFKEPISSVTFLKEAMEEGLLGDIIKEYIYDYENPRDIFVYTTANDVQQMDDYLAIIKKLDIMYLSVEIVISSREQEAEKIAVIEKYNFVTYRFTEGA